MTDVFAEWIATRNPKLVEAERFATNAQPVTFQPPPWKLTPPQRRAKKFQDTVESITRGLNLSLAQKRAVKNWLKGLG
jgi:hypothetical protein